MSFFSRSDLALEFSKKFLDAETNSYPEGMSVKTYCQGCVEITCVSIFSKELSQKMGKPCGRYITLETPPLWNSLLDPQDEILAAADCIRTLLPSEGSILVAGLGNRSITPDALGPAVVERLLATRHLSREMANQLGLSSLRKTAAIAPGVMGQTGIESAEIISAVAKMIHPSAVIAIDALAAEDYSHLGKTIQISDSGIAPGSGVQNRRASLSQESLGVPVIAVGVPTVIDAGAFFPEAVSGPMVTPREVDRMIGHSCKFISLAINKALYPELSLEEIAFLCE